MDMSSELESMGKNMYGHCDAENSISKKALQHPSMKSWNLWIVILNSIKNRKKQRGKKNISGHYKIALKSIKRNGTGRLPQVQRRCGWCNGGNQCDTETFRRLSCKKKISSLIAMRKQAMNDSLQAQQAAYEFSRNSAIVFVAVSMLMILFSLWICLKEL